MTKAESGTPRILWRDEALIAVFKPAAWHCFGGEESLADWLLRQFPELAKVGDVEQPALLHRLDQQTSGLMLAARSDAVYHKMRQAFSAKVLDKEYLSLVCGRLEEDSQVSGKLGGRYRRSRRVWVDDGSRRLRGLRSAQTWIHPLASGSLDGKDLTLALTRMRSGVRHQIRAHLAHLGHPIFGDLLYGAPASGSERFFLHAWRIHGPHPAGGDELNQTCPLPDDFFDVLKQSGLLQALPPESRPLTSSRPPDRLL